MTDAEATSAAIQKALKDVLRTAKAGETVFVYFAGHGTVDPTDNSFYFVSYDADLSDLAATAVPLDRDTGFLRQDRQPACIPVARLLP